MSAVATREREIKLPLAAWETRTSDRGTEYQGVPGTWCDVRKIAGCPKGLLALVCCPACREVFALSDRVHTIDANGRVVNGSVPCTKGTCGFRVRLVLDGWNKKPLYGVAIERYHADTDSWKGEMHHTHADSKREAIAQCANLGGRYRIVDAAPAVGYFVNGDGTVSAD